MTLNQVLWALAGGSAIGFTLGLVGAGGSTLTVPILVYLVGLDPQTAIGTSLIIVGFSALMGAISYWQKGLVQWRTAITFGLAGLGGSLLGSWANHQFPAKTVLFLFALLMMASAVFMVKRPQGKEEGVIPAPRNLSWSILLTGFTIGLLTGFFGMGGGFVIVPALVLLLQFPIKPAIGTSLIIITLNCVSALLGHIRYGKIAWLVALYFLLGSLVGSKAGALLAHRSNPQKLSQTFAILIFGIALYLIHQNLNGIKLLSHLFH